MSKYQEYINRVLKERPTQTMGGTPVEISPDGRSVITRTGRDWYGKGYSVYLPLDYPRLFGWKRGPARKARTPLILNHRGHKYLRLK